MKRKYVKLDEISIREERGYYHDRWKFRFDYDSEKERSLGVKWEAMEDWRGLERRYFNVKNSSLQAQKRLWSHITSLLNDAKSKGLNTVYVHVGEGRLHEISCSERRGYGAGAPSIYIGSTIDDVVKANVGKIKSTYMLASEESAKTYVRLYVHDRKVLHYSQYFCSAFRESIQMRLRKLKTERYERHIYVIKNDDREHVVISKGGYEWEWFDGGSTLTEIL